MVLKPPHLARISNASFARFVFIFNLATEIGRLVCGFPYISSRLLITLLNAADWPLRLRDITKRLTTSCPCKGGNTLSHLHCIPDRSSVSFKTDGCNIPSLP